MQRVRGVVDHGGLLVIEFENQSTLPGVIALTRGDVLSQRPPSSAGVQGISLPEGSVAYPVGHKATLKVALCRTGSPLKQLPTGLADIQQLRRGWSIALDRASRLVLPNGEYGDAIARTRSDLLIASEDEIARPGVDEVGFVLSLVELQRMGEKIDQHLGRLVDAVESILAASAHAAHIPWDVERALFGAQRLFHLAGETRAVADVANSQARLATVSEDPASYPSEMPVGVRGIVWLEDQLVSPRRDGTAVLLARSIPRQWLGMNLEAVGLIADAERTLSCAVRWHGELPALLWE